MLLRLLMFALREDCGFVMLVVIIIYLNNAQLCTFHLNITIAK
jgi:hypothetical protein